MYLSRTLQHIFIAGVITILFSFSSVTLAGNATNSATNNATKSTKLVETTKVAEGVYVFRWWIYRNLFVVTDEGVIATDPMNPKAAELLMQEIRKVTDKPIKYVVYSHNHWDHISGGKIFKDAGAQFVSHEACTKHFKRRSSSAVVFPDITFSDKYVLTLGGKTLELQYHGINHGDCLITMRLPQEKMIFIVDLVTPKRVAFRSMPDFVPDEWIRSLYEIEKLEFDSVIPGHGPGSMPATSLRIVVQEQREYLQDLIAAVKAEWDKGVHSPDALRATVKLPKYKEWRAYDVWFPMNVERIWEYFHMGW